jgi:putative hydrolase of the HAD superfamily
MIKAIIFDFGRVISSQKPLSLFRAYEKDLGLARDSLNRIMFDSPYWRQTLLGRKTADEFWSAIGPELGLTSLAEIDEFKHRYDADESINPAVLTLIQQLHGRYKLAILSNSPPGLTNWLADWGIRDLFDEIFCSGDEGLIKPDPAVYEITLKRLAFLARQTVFIDDTRGHVEAAQKLGINGIVFTNAAELGQKLSHLLKPEFSLKGDGDFF